jgi:Cys-tRNA(Pro)/Cys-tRNA(Cys) deacylase
MSNPSAAELRALIAMDEAGVAYRRVDHGPVRSVKEAAEARGVEVRDVVKTLVVRRADDDYLFVLVPGDRDISWPKLRALLGVSRMSLPNADTALEATGYERGTITPFGSARPWAVVADQAIVGREVALGAGAHGVAVLLQADDIITAFDAVVADVTEVQ